MKWRGYAKLEIMGTHEEVESDAVFAEEYIIQ